MPVTIKKKKTGVKTIRTKRPAAGIKKTGQPESPSAEEQGAAQVPQPQAAPPVAVQPAEKGHNYGIDVTIAMLTLLAFTVLVFVQVSEMSYYSAYPSVWPSPVAGLQSAARRTATRPATTPQAAETETTEEAASDQEEDAGTDTNETDTSDFF